MSRSAFLVFSWLLVLGVSESNVYARSWNPQMYPNPKRDVNLCGRQGRKSNICDPDRILSERAANRIEGIIKEITDGVKPYKKSSCGSKGLQGVQVALALMNKMELDGSIGPQETARRFAKHLHAAWGVGLAECDNGVVLLLSVRDRQIFISTGTGSEMSLSNSNINTIIKWMKPYLKSEDYDEALIRGVTNIGLAVSGWDVSKDEPFMDFGQLIFIIMFGFVAFSLIKGTCSSFRKKRRLSSCQDLLKQIKDEQDKIQSKEWSQPKTCPVCLEAFDDHQPNVLAAADTIINDAKSKSEHPNDCNRESDKLIPDREDSSSSRKRLLLTCGHAVCETCLNSWLQKSATCPICRQDLDSSNLTEPAEEPSSSTREQNRQGLLARDILATDLLFRLRTAQTLYPEFISDSMIDDWSQDATRTGTFDMSRLSNQLVRDQMIAVRQERIGSFGNTSSFGGGTGGGGGAGGSW